MDSTEAFNKMLFQYLQELDKYYSSVLNKEKQKEREKVLQCYIEMASGD